eukprot:CAMPEP_0184257430 /NCGR_PEP_ID=MMETSP0977-20130417/9383_1 /TAXON_ID=483370 /ORGANISM="non described non described, Strain CCMP2097" /LENGTH=754 /DNA_ID=CAMNT_0026563039 /DNA_START=15 /DNA_END=2276 /DNA_ORIENTATION=-
MAIRKKRGGKVKKKPPQVVRRSSSDGGSGSEDSFRSSGGASGTGGSSSSSSGDDSTGSGASSHDAAADDVSDLDGEGQDGYRPGGYHAVSIGDVFASRYQVVEKLGWGHFSTVWMVRDLGVVAGGEMQYVALKVQKSASHYTDAALDEIELLQLIRSKMRDDVSAKTASAKDEGKQRDASTGSADYDNPRLVKLLDHFEHVGPHGRHVCMIFEMLGANLLSVIRESEYRGLPIDAVRNVCRQICIALDFLHRKCGIIHTDLKPENVLLQQPRLSRAQQQALGDHVADGSAAPPKKNASPNKAKNDAVKGAEPVEADLETRMAELSSALAAGDLNGNLTAEERKRLKNRLKKNKQKARKKQLEAGEDDDGDDAAPDDTPEETPTAPAAWEERGDALSDDVTAVCADASQPDEVLAMSPASPLPAFAYEAADFDDFDAPDSPGFLSATMVDAAESFLGDARKISGDARKISRGGADASGGASGDAGADALAQWSANGAPQLPWMATADDEGWIDVSLPQTAATIDGNATLSGGEVYAVRLRPGLFDNFEGGNFEGGEDARRRVPPAPFAAAALSDGDIAAEGFARVAFAAPWQRVHAAFGPDHRLSPPKRPRALDEAKWCFDVGGAVKCLVAVRGAGADAAFRRALEDVVPSAAAVTVWVASFDAAQAPQALGFLEAALNGLVFLALPLPTEDAGAAGLERLVGVDLCAIADAPKQSEAPPLNNVLGPRRQGARPAFVVKPLEDRLSLARSEDRPR